MSSPTGSSQWFANPGSDSYNGVATKSVRFDTASSAHLTRNIGTGNRRLFTYSFWLKRAKIDTSQQFLAKGTNIANADATEVEFTAANTLAIREYVDDSVSHYLITTRLFRDTSAWYNIVIAYDTAQSTAANRVKIYVNGVQETSFGTANYPAQNYDALYTYTQSGSSSLNIGQGWAGGVFYDGYFSDITHIDGAALAPASFGEFNNGIWIPIDTSGLTFGDEGYLLKFDQVGVGTASTSTIGADVSGNTNHFTSSGIVASDCAMPDSPENNFATMNPLIFRTSNGSQVYSENNLKYGQPTANSWGFGFTTLNVKSGKWYAEIRCLGNTSVNAGVVNVGHYGYTKFLVQNPQNNTGVWQLNMDGTGTKTRFNNTLADATYTGFGNGQILGILLNADDKELSFTVDGTLQEGVGSTGVVDISTGGSDKDEWSFFANTFYNSAETMTWNFGQDSSFVGTETATSNSDANGNGTFHTAVPSGYLALCTANLPETDISPNSDTQATDHFNTVIYTGNGSGQTITGVGLQPDWTWNKNRVATDFNILQDSSRGPGKEIFSNSTSDEESYSTSITSWNSDGFVLGGREPINANNESYASWNWKANGGTTTTNDASSTSIGSIDSVIQANTTAGFSIVVYTGVAASNQTVAHGLQVGGVATVPEMIMIKKRGSTSNWNVIHPNRASNDHYLQLNSGSVSINTNTPFANTAPTTTVFTVGASDGDVNTDGESHVAYCFASVEGYSKISSFTGNVNADGTFVYLGFKPAWVILKRTTGGSTYNWFIHDNKRGASNVNNERLNSDTNEVEATNITSMDFLSNGFKIRTANTSYNQGTFIYMAFADQPFKYSNAK